MVKISVPRKGPQFPIVWNKNEHLQNKPKSSTKILTKIKINRLTALWTKYSNRKNSYKKIVENYIVENGNIEESWKKFWNNINQEPIEAVGER